MNSKARANLFLSQVKKRLSIPKRLQEVVAWYLQSLTLNSRKHTQSFASQISGRHKAQFSRLLSRHRALALRTLERLSQQESKRVCQEKLRPVIPGSPWKVAIIIDSTLHVRSSDRVHNATMMTSSVHRGFIDGHRWTNIVLMVNDRLIPLPPIPHYTRAECRARGEPYKTEIDRIAEFLKTFQIWEWIGFIDPSEIVVIADGAYEARQFHRAVRLRRWDFLTRVNKQRLAALKEYSPIHILRNWLPLEFLFNFPALKDESPWQTVRTLNSQGPGRKKKRKDFRIRSLHLVLRGSGVVKVVCSELHTSPGFRFIACSNTKVDAGVLFRLYRKRWLIETFHKSVKSYLGMEDAGVWDFDSLQAHIHWVYTTYLLLMGQASPKETIHNRQAQVQAQWKSDDWRNIIQLSTRYGGTKAVREYCHAAMMRLLAS